MNTAANFPPTFRHQDFPPNPNCLGGKSQKTRATTPKLSATATLSLGITDFGGKSPARTVRQLSANFPPKGDYSVNTDQVIKDEATAKPHHCAVKVGDEFCKGKNLRLLGGRWLCTLHVTLYERDLAGYADYQRTAFAEKAMAMDDDALRTRRDELTHMHLDDPSLHATDPLHFHRLSAERDALAAEIRRRQRGGARVESVVVL